MHRPPSKRHTPSDSQKRLHVVNIGTIGDGPKRGQGIFLASSASKNTRKSPEK